MKTTKDLISIKEASIFATEYTGKKVSDTNIQYLVQFGRIKKIGDNGSTMILKEELKNYYDLYLGSREAMFKAKLGKDLNWALSFDQFRESETTKHVHRLHPYKGKFIPQLVEYFLDNHTDNFKKEIYFKPGDIVLDPFSGSGTTLIQACELGIHGIGIDVSLFNSLIGESKISEYNLPKVQIEINKITNSLKKYINDSNIKEFEDKLLLELKDFNNKYFPVPDYKYKLNKKEIDESKYGKEKELEFINIFKQLVENYNIKLNQNRNKNFLDIWYTHHVRDEIQIVLSEINKIRDKDIKKILSLILSRTIRSCRATTHSDLATIYEPKMETYYCHKHGKICKPLFSILKWWKSYSQDTIKRLFQFSKLRTKTFQTFLTGDSRNIDIFEKLMNSNKEFYDLIQNKKIKGIFSSPPYVGLIDYHKQHAYAYDLFGYDRNDDLEIGPLYKGQGKEAKLSYIKGISEVLNNCKKYMVDDFDVFLVANDKYNMYPTIAENSGMRIVNQYKRPVLNRTEKDKGAYSEIIFHLKSR